MDRATARGRRRSRSLVVLILALALVAVFGVAAQQAMALPTFTLAEKGIGPCQTCHGMAATHANANHASLACTSCHATSTATPPLPTACGACHGGPSAILASTSHTAQGCGTTPGCHGAPAPKPVTPVMTIKASASSVKVKKPITLSGKITPTSLAGKSVKVTIQMKSGTKWKTVKSASAKISATGAYSYKYTSSKKGTFQAQVSMAAATGFNAGKSPWKSFKVK